MPVTVTEGLAAANEGSLFLQRSTVTDVRRDFKCDSVLEGLHHWGYTRES